MFANKSPSIPLYKRGKGRGILKAMLSRLSGDRKHCPTKQIPIVVSLRRFSRSRDRGDFKSRRFYVYNFK